LTHHVDQLLGVERLSQRFAGAQLARHGQIVRSPRGAATGHDDDRHVRIYLPRLETSRLADAAVEVKPKSTEEARETILLVEDDEDVRDFIGDSLRELGYQVFAAGDGQSALQVLDERPDIDLLFTDVGLPNGMNGRALAEQARRRRRTLKVLFTTGYARNAIIHHGRLDAGVDLIAKPYTQTELAAKVRKVLDR